MKPIEFEDEELWEILIDEHEFAKLVDIDTYRDGWYEHKTVKFAYENALYEFAFKEHVTTGDTDIVEYPKLCDEQLVTINEEEEAHYIWQELMKVGKGDISKEDIKLIISLQQKYFESINLV